MLSRVVNGTVDVLNVDGIVQKIDVNELLERVDWDKVLDKIDIDKVIQRVDINKLLEKVDVVDLVERAEIPAIVARSTTGVFAPLIDSCRSQIVVVDQALQGVGWIRKSGVPQAPGLPGEEDLLRFPKGGSNIAVVVQERFAGTFSRTLAFLIDTFVTSALFYFVLLFIEKGVEVVTSKNPEIGFEWSWTMFFINWIWQYLYFATALVASSRTFGKVIVGLKVVNYEDGTPVKAKRALIRTLFLYFNIWSLVGVLIGVVRKDRREFHDLIAGTGVVYSWDARMARYRQETAEGNAQLFTSSMQHSESQHTSLRRRILFNKKDRPKKADDEEKQELKV